MITRKQLDAINGRQGSVYRIEATADPQAWVLTRRGIEHTEGRWRKFEYREVIEYDATVRELSRHELTRNDRAPRLPDPALS